MQRLIRYWRSLLLAGLALVAGCGTDGPPLVTVPHVELQRFMGDWHVIANIPTYLERNAYNALESYALLPDGSIATTFTFNKGGFDGPQKRHTPRGYVLDSVSNARWGMRFVWPVKADYQILYLTPDYSVTVVGRQARDYLWIMARTPRLSEAEYQSALNAAAMAGYDISRVQKVPQA